MYRISLLLFFLSPVFTRVVAAATPDSLKDALTGINKLGSKGDGHAAAMSAWKTVAAADASLLPEILGATSKERVLANNWIRAAVESIVDRELAAGRQLPLKQLQDFLESKANPARGREIAFDLVTRFNPTNRERLLSGMLNDPSLELRRQAITKALTSAEKELANGDKKAAVETIRNVLNHARDTDQIDEAAKKLRDAGEPVNLTQHFGFITQWHLLAPFDNTNTSGFDKDYAPENSIDLNATYVGKNGDQIRWVRHATKNEYGLVDLNKALDKHKGAVAYAYAEFVSAADQPIDLRLGCINANKIWLNGEFIAGNHVYHAGEGIDQYIAQGKLKQGKNQILLKICQNEQTEDWAQVWQFQFRLCDELGTAVLSK